MALSYAILKERGVLAVSGGDAREFLQGLVSNDVDRVTPERAVYAALLTPQGKYLHDFLIAELDGRLLLDCEGARLADLARRLALFRLRADVAIDDVSGAFTVAVLFGDGVFAALGLAEAPGSAGPIDGGIAFTDPRLSAVGARAILPVAGAATALEAAGFEAGDEGAYDNLRLVHGVPDGSRDMIVEKSVLLESGFEELHGVDFEKGCYVGQEVTARTKYRGLVRKRLIPVIVDGPLPDPGTPVMRGQKEAGEMRSGRDGVALALLRLEQVEEARERGETLTAGEATITPRKPDWAAF